MQRPSEKTAGQWWSTPGDSLTLPLAGVEALAHQALIRAGATPGDARYIAAIHIDKALQGDHERGVGMLARQICDAAAGRIDLRAEPWAEASEGATARVLAPPRASSKLVCRFAAALAVQKARTFGTGCVAARAKAEILTPFLQDATGQGMISLILAQSVPMVAPFGAAEPLLGNAPLGWGIPNGPEGPILVDMSLTTTSAKGVVAAAAAGQPLAPGMILNAEGRPSTRAADFTDPRHAVPGAPRGSLTPLGSGHKGYALVFISGLIAPLLAEGRFAWDLGSVGDDPGDFSTLFITLDPSRFTSPRRLRDRISDYITRLRAARRPAGAGPPLYPGERSQQMKRDARNAGLITLPREHYDALKAAP